jgi:putative aldouronate transport system permease protein
MAKSYWAARLRLEDRLFDIVNFLILVFVGIITLYPFLNVLAVSLNESIDTVRGGITVWPRDFTLHNYERLLQNLNLWSAAAMSVLRTAVGATFATVSTILVAYALSRREFPLRTVINVALVITMYVSGGLIPEYMLYRSLGLLNNFWVYIFPTMATAFNIIIVRTYIRTQPNSFVESGRLDGANEFRIIFSIVVPLIMPVVAVIILFVSVNQWNSWVDTYIFASRAEHLTTLQYELQKRISSAMQSMAQTVEQSSQQAIQEQAQEGTRTVVLPRSVRAAMTMVTVIPIIMVYPFLQRFFVSGILVGGLKD